MKSLNTRTWLAAAAACTALVGCQQRVIDSGREAGGSDEIDTRLALDAKGRPLAGARIALVKAGDSTGRLAALSSTGTGGQYPSFNVPDGAYSATLRDAQDSLGKFLDTLQIAGGHARVGRDTLLALGKIRGVVRLVGGETPASVILSLYGTDIAANVRKDGSFEIDLVPGGLFTLMGTTSLDGYGTLLRRLQLRDGQDLVIPDTLSLPVTGLLAPHEIWAESDTATGDVRVRWSTVDHPNRMGYVLETLENGVVTSSQFLKDTTWKDSLSTYWEGLPLLGPWPSRERVYRVRTRSLDGSGDTRSMAKTLVAKAPEWTHRVDSVKVVVENDSLKRVRKVRWNAIQHPDVVGWRVERIADGKMDCSKEVSGETWSDVNCIDPSFHRDTVSESHDVWKKAITQVQFHLYPVRKNGHANVVKSSYSFVLPPDGHDVVEWGEPESSPSWEMYESVGDWIMRGNRQFEEISKDGLSWIPLPEKSTISRVIAKEDTVWQIYSFNDSVRYFKMKNGEEWESRTVQLPASLVPDQWGWLANGWQLQFGVRNGKLAGWGKHGSLESSTEAQILDDSGWKSVKWDYVDAVFSSGHVISDAKGLCKIGFDFGTQVKCGEDSSDYAMGLFSKVGLLPEGTVAGVGQGICFSCTQGVRSEGIFITKVHGLSYQTRGPAGVPADPASYSWTLFRGRIWASYQGKLWKGKVYLPPAD